MTNVQQPISGVVRNATFTIENTNASRRRRYPSDDLLMRGVAAFKSKKREPETQKSMSSLPETLNIVEERRSKSASDRTIQNSNASSRRRRYASERNMERENEAETSMPSLPENPVVKEERVNESARVNRGTIFSSQLRHFQLLAAVKRFRRHSSPIDHTRLGSSNEVHPERLTNSWSAAPIVQPRRSILKKEPSIDGDPSQVEQNTARQENTVKFDRVETREFDRTIGDNPAVSSGIPIGLDWGYNPEHKIQDLDEYEIKRRPRLSLDELVLRPGAREEMLIRDWGVSFGEMHQTATETDSIKRWRLASAMQNQRQMRIEEVMESTRKRVGRIITRRSEKKEQQLLWVRAQKKMLVTNRNIDESLVSV